MKGVKHYTASGKTHTSASKKLFHYSGLSKAAQAKTKAPKGK